MWLRDAEKSDGEAVKRDDGRSITLRQPPGRPDSDCFASILALTICTCVSIQLLGFKEW